MTRPIDFITTLEALIAATEQSLMAQTGGENVCRIEKTGRVAGGVKYDEGRLVALRAARRLVTSTDDMLPRAELDRLLEKWRTELQSQQARSQPSQHWLAYNQGGVDALEQLLPIEC